MTLHQFVFPDLPSRLKAVTLPHVRIDNRLVRYQQNFVVLCAVVLFTFKRCECWNIAVLEHIAYLVSYISACLPAALVTNLVRVLE